MKLKSFLLLMVLLSLDSFAVTGRDSWGDIRRSEEVMIQQPTFAGIFGSEGLFNACTTDEEFKSIRPVRNCLEYVEILRQSDRGPFKDYVCTAYETKQVTMSRTYIQNDYVTSVYPTTFSFVVLETDGSTSGRHVFSKTFALQSCD